MYHGVQTAAGSAAGSAPVRRKSRLCVSPQDLLSFGKVSCGFVTRFERQSSEILLHNRLIKASQSH